MVPWTFNCLQHSISVTLVHPDSLPRRAGKAVSVVPINR